MRKARQTTAINASAVADINNATVVARLRTKYPDAEAAHTPPRVGSPEDDGRPLDRLLELVSGGRRLAKHICEKKRGASTCPNGQSNDDYQDLIAADDEVIDHLMTIVNLILTGQMVEGPGRKVLIDSKGTVLKKGEQGDVRPVATETPLMHYAGHCFVRENKDDIQKAVGKEQLMGTSAGCEVACHGIRALLMEDHRKVVGTRDAKNAYGSIHHDVVLEMIGSELPELLPFTSMMLQMAPIETIYHDRASGATVVLPLSRGIPQGGEHQHPPVLHRAGEGHQEGVP
jgi:hypothetical protein